MQYYIGQTVFEQSEGEQGLFHLVGEDTLLVQLFRFEHRDGRTYIVYTEEAEQDGSRAVYAGLLAKDGSLWTVDDPTAETYIEILLEEMMHRMPQIQTLAEAPAAAKEAFLEEFCAVLDRRMAEVIQE